MILGRAESFASRQPVGVAVLDALGTAVGFALALLILGSVRELLGYGTLLREMDLLFGETARSWIIELSSTAIVPLALFPPGAFLLAGLLFALAQGLAKSRPSATHNPSGQVDATVDYEK
jgi:electron transport complex protein RnfE